MKQLKIICLAITLCSSSIGHPAESSPVSQFLPAPGDIASRVANRIVEETTFAFRPSLPKDYDEGYAYLDFFDSLGSSDNSVYYARADVNIDREVPGHRLPDDKLATAKLGISHSAGDVEIKLDGMVIYQGKSNKHEIPRGIDYDRFTPANYVKLARLINNQYRLSIKFAPLVKEQARIWIGFFAKSGAGLSEQIKLTPPSMKDAPNYIHFLIAGPVDGAKDGINIAHPLNAEDINFTVDYKGVNGRKVRWDVPRIHLQRKHADKLDYADWRYFTGTILDALYKVTDVFESLDYDAYINQHMNFFREKSALIGREREEYGILHSPFGHFFRYALLDDTGVTALPYAQRFVRTYGEDTIRHLDDPDYKIAQRAVDHILSDVPRLKDGTLARVNPVPLTIWADDMFMGTGILMRMAEAMNEPSYHEEAVKQILQIDSYLSDPKTGVYWHGWFGDKQSHSSSKWARANGWTMMAKTDALLATDKSHAQYADLLKAFQRHARGLLKLQSSEGRWHQVLDSSNTYLETSASAMFVRAFAEGLRNGWLEWDEFTAATFKGWRAVTNQVRQDGLVDGIVKGTPILFSDEQYNNHPIRLNDPRGLGAILYMTASMERLRMDREDQ